MIALPELENEDGKNRHVTTRLKGQVTCTASVLDLLSVKKIIWALGG